MIDEITFAYSGWLWHHTLLSLLLLANCSFIYLPFFITILFAMKYRRYICDSYIQACWLSTEPIFLQTLDYFRVYITFTLNDIYFVSSYVKIFYTSSFTHVIILNQTFLLSRTFTSCKVVQSIPILFSEAFTGITKTLIKKYTVLN